MKAQEQAQCQPNPNPTPVVAELETVININSGGPAFEFEAEIWTADTFNTASNKYAKNKPIEDTDNDQLYQTEANDSTGGFHYQISVDQSQTFYQVTLHFAEIFHGVDGRGGGPGKRIFDYDVEGQIQVDNFDLLTVTDPLTAIVFTYDSVNVSDGVLDIQFTSIKDRAKVSGIEVAKWVVN